MFKCSLRYWAFCLPRKPSSTVEKSVPDRQKRRQVPLRGRHYVEPGSHRVFPRGKCRGVADSAFFPPRVDICRTW